MSTALEVDNNCSGTVSTSAPVPILDDDLQKELLELAQQVAEQYSNPNEDVVSEQIDNLDEEKQHVLDIEERTSSASTSSSSGVEAQQRDESHYESFKRIDTNNNKNSVTDVDHNNKENLFIDDDFQLPEPDWANLEAKLKIDNQEIAVQNKRANLNNDREEIRRKLAIVSSSSSSSSLFNDQIYNTNENIISDYMRKPSLSKQHYLAGQNLQICFMNEAINNDEPIENNETLEPCVDEEVKVEHYSRDHQQQHDNSTLLNDELNQNKLPTSSSSFSVLSVSSNESSCDNFLNQLQNDIKLALSKVPCEVRSQIQSESISSKKTSPIADIVGLPTYGLKRLEREHIVDMNIGQLQVIVNDLCNQIEKINEELKKLLIDRDDLYMQQDSLLVDIEDLTRRIQELSLRYKHDSAVAIGCQSILPNEDSKSHLTKLIQSTSTMALADKINSFLHLTTNNTSMSSSLNSGTNNNTTSDMDKSTITSNSMNGSKPRLFQLSNFTNKLYRFTKKS